MNNQSFCCDGGDLQLFTDLGPQSVTDTAPALYFYHPDHLGSTAMVTDFDGHITQNVVYIPYGEVFVEERNGNWASPYLFNAKELDEETGLYYYGARYLDPSIALWLSTDPLQGKYPGMSPYNYCAGNPVKYIDIDGNVILVAFTGGPLGGGKIVQKNSSDAGTTGKLVQKAERVFSEKGLNYSCVVITPGLTASSSIKSASDFFKENYSEGEDVVIYGYSYGGDFAEEFAEKLNTEGISIK